jgi:hypothetical protein
MGLSELFPWFKRSYLLILLLGLGLWIYALIASSYLARLASIGLIAVALLAAIINRLVRKDDLS